MIGARILVAEDYRATREKLCGRLKQAGYETAGAANGQEALRVARNSSVDLVLSDHNMPEMDGLELFSELMKIGDIPFILYSSAASTEVSFLAGKQGAVGFLNYPFSIESQLLPTIRDTLRRSARGIPASGGRSVGRLLGNSRHMNQVRAEISRYAPLPTNVLITGETGTGKDLIAHSIHALSPRANRKMVKVNCPALPGSLLESELFGHEKGSFTGASVRRRGRFEIAHQSTIFLDEIGELDLAAQAKLLQVLQNGEFDRVGGNATIGVDVRVLSATNRDLTAEIQHGRFREDLYYRIAQSVIHVPPLRDRTEDLATLMHTLLLEISERYGLPPAVPTDTFIDALNVQPWKGNVRELRAVLERVVVCRSGTAPLDALSFHEAYAALNPRLNPAERLLCQQMLQAFTRNKRNQEAARKELGMTRSRWRHHWEAKFHLHTLGRGNRR